MSLFVLGALLIQIVQPCWGGCAARRKIGLAWLLNALYFAAFTAWALARNEAGGAAFWEHVAVDFCLSQFIILPVSLWFFDFQKFVLARAGLTAEPRRAGDAFKPADGVLPAPQPAALCAVGPVGAALYRAPGWAGMATTLENSDYERLERRQTLRRILQPGPRGQILDRNRMPLVINQPHFSVVLYLDEMRKEFNDEFDRLRKAWLAQAHDDTSEVHPTLDRNKLYKQAASPSPTATSTKPTPCWANQRRWMKEPLNCTSNKSPCCPLL